MLGAGAIHGLLVREHLREWWGYGLFFLATSLLQLLLALALLTDAVNARDTGARWRDVKRWAYVLAIAGNSGLILLYAVTRTVGIPFFGPEAGAVEAVSLVDIVSKVLEAVAIVLLATLLARTRGDPRST
jgi:DMSO/TMAO reductase YedYZ heme-binding membrane subunit